MKRFALVAALLAALLGAPGPVARAAERCTTEVVYVLESPAQPRRHTQRVQQRPPRVIRGHSLNRNVTKRLFVKHRALLC